ncbi:hypothetical protein NDI85_02170 [Halomicroarcula sp. S1AR25-4]|uniref:DUF8165 domain-containing protein n=1 Tax=Haloarcula onubensis TaxID=2950539 RepID=A0ABU2FUT3_9EURY|nr:MULTISPECIES: hypothetical protein [unclassified Halomicroarcula]MDS0276587.1 hypothetical protein [Halomicroarcula sp. S1AR25-4]MDS0284017.1 hypothetical protein [Halomicroarcula sp. S3CR25-11]
MLKGHFNSAGASISHGDAGVLFPVTDLIGTIHQYREAELALEAVDSSDVIVIAPTSLASSYALTQHILTAIAIETLSPAVQSHLDEALEEPIEDFKLIQIGKWIVDASNHSLAEFADA